MSEPSVRVAVHPDLLSRREQFAMAALQGILADPNMDDEITFEGFAERAVMMADALVAELDKAKP